MLPVKKKVLFKYSNQFKTSCSVVLQIWFHDRSIWPHLKEENEKLTDKRQILLTNFTNTLTCLGRGSGELCGQEKAT